jgi:hypothetical protein
MGGKWEVPETTALSLKTFNRKKRNDGSRQGIGRDASNNRQKHEMLLMRADVDIDASHAADTIVACSDGLWKIK